MVLAAARGPSVSLAPSFLMLGLAYDDEITGLPANDLLAVHETRLS